MTAEGPYPPSLVLFDGVCGLCDHLVRFLVRIDHARSLRYAPLQGETAGDLRKLHPEIPADVETVVFVEGGHVFLRSRAAFAIVRRLGWPWRAFAVFAILPTFVTDLGYRAIARVRYRIFGKHDACRIPQVGERELFLP